ATVRIPEKIFSESKIICAAWCWSPSAAPVQNSGRNNVPDKLFLDSRCRATMCVGEPHEAITHHSFNRGADDCCRSVAHNSCQRLGLGLARRMGMGRWYAHATTCVLSMNNRPKSRVSVAPAIVAAGELGDGWAGAWRDREYFRGQAGRQSDIRPHLFDHLV